MGQASQDSNRRFHRRTVRVLVDYCAADGIRCEYATTLGAGGLFVETDCPSPPDSQLELRFRVAEGLGLHQIAGRVGWVRSEERDGHARSRGMGVQFTDSAGCSALARDLESLEHAS